jgi:AcrR family transcriptional regulator
VEKNGLRHLPLQERGRLTMDAVLGAAFRLLSAPKPRQRMLSTNALARVAGVSIGALYHYFPNKESVLRKLGERLFDEEYRAYESLLERVHTLPIAESMAEVVRFNLVMHKKDAALRRVLMQMLGVRSDATLMRCMQQRFTHASQAALERRPEFHGRSMERAARLMVVTSDQVISEHLAGSHSDATEEALVHDLAQMFASYTRDLQSN